MKKNNHWNTSTGKWMKNCLGGHVEMFNTEAGILLRGVCSSKGLPSSIKWADVPRRAPWGKLSLKHSWVINLHLILFISFNRIHFTSNAPQRDGNNLMIDWNKNTVSDSLFNLSNFAIQVIFCTLSVWWHSPCCRTGVVARPCRWNRRCGAEETLPAG